MAMMMGTHVDENGRIRELPVLVDQYGRPITNAARHAGERQEDSAVGADHVAVAGEWAISGAIDLSGNPSTVVYDGPALLGGIWVEVAIGVAAAALDDNVTTRLGLPIALSIGFHALPGIIFAESLIVNPADASTGTIRVLYRPLDSRVTWPY